MSRKVIPEVNVKISEYINKARDDISEISSDIEDNLNKIVDNEKLNKFIEKRKKDLKVINNKCFKCYNALSLLYDHSIDNLPGAAIFGILLTIISFSYTWTGINGVNSTFQKYFPNNLVNSFVYYCMISSILILVLHLAILLHGISIFILETTREVCVISKVGCYCCKNKSLRKCCICFQACAQTITQIIWGIFGTVSCLVVYGSSIVAFNVSSVATVSSYVMKNSCSYFKIFTETLKNKSKKYLILAKNSVGKADSVMLMVLSQYNAWVDMKNKFLDSGINTISTITDETTNSVDTYEYSNTELNFQSPQQFEYERNYGRLLVETNTTTEFNILNQLSKGQSILSILNNSIYDTERQIEYYDTIFNQSIVVCNDYGNMYDSFYYITIGIGILLFSHLIMSAVHYKYFSIWMYEVKLVKLNK